MERLEFCRGGNLPMVRECPDCIDRYVSLAESYQTRCKELEREIDKQNDKERELKLQVESLRNQVDCLTPLVAANNDLRAELAKQDLQNRELQDALHDLCGTWEHNWDCSMSPGHKEMNDAVDKAQAVLGKSQKRKCVVGCMDRHFCNAPKLHEGGCHCKLEE